MGIIHPKLSQLRLSPLNQRRVKPSAIESMADDIQAHGLLQNRAAPPDQGRAAPWRLHDNVTR